MAEPGWCMYLSYVSTERCRGGAAPCPHRALHVARDPLIRPADVEGRLVRPVERADRHHVARAPARDVAERERVHPPAAEEDGLRVARLLAESVDHLLGEL